MKTSPIKKPDSSSVLNQTQTEESPKCSKIPAEDVLKNEPLETGSAQRSVPAVRPIYRKVCAACGLFKLNKQAFFLCLGKLEIATARAVVSGIQLAKGSSTRQYNVPSFWAEFLAV